MRITSPPKPRPSSGAQKKIGQWMQGQLLLSLLIGVTTYLGLLIIGVPYSIEGMIHTEARGGTPYGATTISGLKGELAPTPEDLAICRAQGKRVAELTKKIRS